MSEVINLDRKVYKFKLDGKIYEACKPSFGMIQEMQGKTSGRDENDPENLDLMLDLLDKCGLPKEVMKEAESDHFQIVVENLIGDVEKK